MFRVRHVDYKERWLAAVSLLGETGRLTPEEVRSISGTQTLTQKGLPPVDDLAGMKSWDIEEVMEARMEHGTA